MSTEPTGPGQNDKRPPRRITTRDLRRHALCKKRYGRATLTIRRFGPRLVGEHELAVKIDGFRDGKASAEEVVWALVGARVEAHSPTFSWQGADRARLISLVAECSIEPKLPSAEVESIAQALVAAQDEEEEQLRQFAKQFSRSLGSATNLSTLFTPSYLDWAEQQRRTLAALVSSFGSGPNLARQMKELSQAANMVSRGGGFGVAEQLAGQMRENQALFRGLTTPRLSETLRLPEFPMHELSRSLKQTLEATQYRPMAIALEGILDKQLVSIRDVLGAARSAADVMVERGAFAQAEELRVVTEEVREVAKNPSFERLEMMVADLSQKIEDDSKKRELNESDALVLQLFFFFLSVYLALFLWLIGPPSGP